MPLSKSESHLKLVFEKEYGKKKGDSIFYGYEAEHFPKFRKRKRD